MQEILQDIRVLDLTRYEAGPTCTLLLAFLGAEVIKVENPILRETDRYLFSKKGENEDLYFVLLNLNKKSITLDIETKEGRLLLVDLVKHSDVLVENFGQNKMEKWEISYEKLINHNPRLIYASVSGYGSYGSLAFYPSFDMIAQAMGGIMSITGEKDDPPLRCGATVADSSGGNNLALGIVAALYKRERTGKGMKLEVSLQDSVVNLGRSLLGTHIAFGAKAPKMGNQLRDVVPWNIYPTKKGGYIAICIIQQHLFEKFMKVIGNSELVEQYDLTSLKKRKQKREIIEQIISEWSTKRTKEEAIEILCSQNIPCGAVLDSLELADNSHLQQRKMITEIEHYQWDKIKVLGSPIKFFDSSIPIKSSPQYGEHNKEIFLDLLSLEHKKYSSLKQQGII